MALSYHEYFDYFGELHEIMTRSRDRAREVSAILGHHLMEEIERAVRILNAICEKIRTVDQGINGIFLVESEIMFVPATVSSSASITSSRAWATLTSQPRSTGCCCSRPET